MSARVFYEPQNCPKHPTFSALAVCSLCGRAMCGVCHNTSLVGYAVCKGCPVLDELTPKTQWERARGLRVVYGYVHTAVEVISGPRMFFLKYPKGGMADALIFGYVSLLIAFSASRVWGYLFLGRFDEAMRLAAEQAEIGYREALWLYFALTPVSALFGLGLFTGLLYAGLRFVGGKNVTWTSVSWIAGLSSASLLFQVIPPVLEFPVGQLLGMLWLLNILFLATQVRFELTFMRAMGATMIPFWVLTTMAS